MNVKTLNVNSVLKTIESLPLEEQFYIVEVVNRRIQELQRKQLANRAKEAELNYQSGSVSSGNVDDLFSALEND
jgi:hypothetical protein